MRNTLAIGMTLGMLVALVAGLALVAAADQDGNDDFASAEAITPGIHQGSLTDTVDEMDYYKFTVVAGQSIHLTLNSSVAGDFVYLTLYDWDEYSIFELKSKDSVEAYDAFFTANETGTQTWYAHLWMDTAPGDYVFELALVDANDAGTGTDAGGDIATAIPIGDGVVVGGHVEDLDDYDYYAFVAGSGDVITIDFTSESTTDDIYLVLYDWDTSEIFDINTRSGVTVTDTWWTQNETLERAWYVKVMLDTGPGDYSLLLTITHQDDGGSGDDAGGSFGTAQLIGDGTFTGHLEDDDSEDYYAFWAGSGDIINITFVSQSLDDDIYLYLFDMAQDTLLSLQTKLDMTVKDVYYTKNETAVALFYIEVMMDTDHGDYELVVELIHQNDAGLYDDAPEDLLAAPAILPGLHQGHLEDEDDFDVFKVAAGTGDMLTVTFTSGSMDDYTYLELVRGDDTVYWTLESMGGSSATKRYYTSNETPPLWFYVRVWMDTSPGDYTFDLSVERQDDAGMGKDATEACEAAFLVENGVVDGHLGDLDTMDVYRVEVMGGWMVYLNLTNKQPVSMSAAIVGDCGAGTVIGTVTSMNGQVGRGSWTVPLNVTKGSFWHIRVTAASGKVPDAYQFELFVKETPPDQETPMITFSDPPGAQSGQPLTITAVVTDNVMVLDVMLYFKIDDEVTWHVQGMTKATGNNYTATIPGASINGTNLRFYFIARDTSMNDRSHGSEANPRTVSIIPPDAVPPQLTYKPPSQVEKGKDFTFTVEATDNVGVEDVTAYFKVDDEITWHELKLTMGDGKYTGTIPSASLEGKTLHYYIVVKDAAGGTATYGTETAPKSLAIKKKDDGPGFGAALAAAAVATALVLAARRRRR